jgi:hypothetical protein
MFESDKKASNVVIAGVLALALGCSAGVKATNTTGAAGSTGTDAGVDRPSIVGTSGTTGGSGPNIVGTGGATGAAGTGGACTPTYTCDPVGGRYCNTIGNGCKGQKVDCGACPGDATCSGGTTMPGICIGGPSCTAITCTSGGGAQYCGKVGDGCGRELDCGACAAGQVCNGGLCVPANCTPLSCAIAGGGQYCGKIGDGCGGTLDCQGCSAPQTCGAYVPGVCGTPVTSCTNRLNCKPMGGQYCGVVGDNCGSTIDCGTCDNGMACRSDHVCPATGPGPCSNLQCQLDKAGECTGSGTTISGQVFDPAAKNPLYNVLLYVPNTALGPIPTGASCDRCDSPISGTPVAAALSGADGKFKIMNAPSGTNIPLVIQIGKWRRKIILPTVTKCQDNAFNDPNTVRLPRSMSDRGAGDTAGDVHMPQIALSTGHSDAFDCLLRKIGIADTEFTPDSSSGRVHMYVGGAGKSGDQGSAMLASGTKFADSYGTLFPNYGKMTSYDMIVLQCEGEQLANEKMPFLGNMKKYADHGGRVFSDHLHSAWIRTGLPPWPATADWIGVGTDLPNPVMASVDTSFPKGMALSQWLVNTGASTTVGQISLKQGQHSVAAVNAPAARRWIWVPQNVNDSAKRESTQYLTFNTPVESSAANQCGRVVFTDIHVANVVTDANNNVIPAMSDLSHPDIAFPNGCKASLDMTPQEKALEFMFFDLSSCVQVETGTPELPPIPKPGTAPMPPPISTPAPPAPPPPPPPPPPLDPDMP